MPTRRILCRVSGLVFFQFCLVLQANMTSISTCSSTKPMARRRPMMRQITSQFFKTALADSIFKPALVCLTPFYDNVSRQAQGMVGIHPQFSASNPSLSFTRPRIRCSCARTCSVPLPVSPSHRRVRLMLASNSVFFPLSLRPALSSSGVFLRLQARFKACACV